MANWNRSVSLASDGTTIFLSVGWALPGEGRSNPDGSGGGDDPSRIIVRADPTDPPTVTYWARVRGLVLQDLAWAPGSDTDGITWEAKEKEGKLIVTDRGLPSHRYAYFLVGTYNGATVLSTDPQIHNSTSPPVDQ